jgi:hypothetical protein
MLGIVSVATPTRNRQVHRQQAVVNRNLRLASPAFRIGFHWMLGETEEYKAVARGPYRKTQRRRG